MSKTWQLQDAKNRFSEVVEGALKGEPQIITRRGVETAVVLSYEDFKSMKVCCHNLSHFFQKSPLVAVKLDVKREKSPSRQDLKI
jgi:prevent-host-death family protein